MGAEDFSFSCQMVPCSFSLLGISDETLGTSHKLHNAITSSSQVCQRERMSFKASCNPKPKRGLPAQGGCDSHRHGYPVLQAAELVQGNGRALKQAATLNPNEGFLHKGAAIHTATAIQYFKLLSLSKEKDEL
eukprot:gene26399-17495_t